jgi:hypothetical protein
LPELHPAGVVRARIEDHGYSTAKSGNDQFVVRFQTKHGSIASYFSLSDKAADWTVEKIRAMGYEGDDMGALADGTALRGRFCMIEVRHEEYGGRMRAKVAFVNPDGWEPGIQRSEDAAVNAKRFNALLKRKPKPEPRAAGGSLAGTDEDFEKAPAEAPVEAPVKGADDFSDVKDDGIPF